MAETTIQQNNASVVNSRIRNGSKVGAYISVVVALIFILVPLYIVISTSLMSAQEAHDTSFAWWPRRGVTLQAYQRVFETELTGFTLQGSIVNSLLLYVPSTLVGTIVSAMAAFAFAKLDFYANKPCFAILMASLTLPNCMNLISSVLVFNTLGWLGSPLPIMVPRMVGTIGVIFFLRQFYMGIPEDLLGAGYIDGLNEISVFFHILLPISIPALTSQFILQFIAGYNQYLEPLIYLPSAEWYTLQVALGFFSGAYGVNDWPVRMVGCVIAMAPLIILYLIAQKYILMGVGITSGLKG